VVGSGIINGFKEQEEASHAKSYFESVMRDFLFGHPGESGNLAPLSGA
jgi:hypothetical protein